MHGNGTERPPTIASSLFLQGDLGALRPDEKFAYYTYVCQRLGLDPMMQPFKLLRIDRKEILYCDRAGAEQLNAKHEISHEVLEREEESGVYTVLCRATLPSGRFVDSSGSVAVAELTGVDRANAMMTAETKAKRRATLSLLGLGMLDETEVGTIRNAKVLGALSDPRAEREVALQATPSAGHVADDRFPAGLYQGKTLQEVLIAKGAQQIENAVTGMERSHMYSEFVQRARHFLLDNAASSVGHDPSEAIANIGE